MNVANLVTMTGAPTNPVVTGGKPLDSAVGSLNPLFALQLGAVLEGLQEEQTTGELQLFLDQDTLDDAVDNLLALLDQLLAEGILTPEQHVHFTASLDVEQAAQNVTLKSDHPLLQVTGKEQRQLVATFMQLGMPGEQAVALADVLTNASRAENSVLQSILNPKEDAVDSLLNKLLQPAQAAQGETAVADGKQRPAVTVQAAAPQQFAEASLESKPNLLVNQTMQPLRLQQALASYQAESGSVTRNQKLPLQQVAMLGSQMPSAADETSSVNQTPAVATWQISQSQWLNQPQGTAQPNSYPVQSQHFTEQVSQLFVKQLKLTETNGITEAKLVLYPRSLGQINVRISAHNGVITAHFTAETASGKELLDNQLGQLRIALIQQGLQVDRLEVNHQPSTQQHAFDFQQQREQGRQQQHRQSAETFSSTDEQAEFSLEALTDDNASLNTLLERARTAGNRLYSAYA